ncbi:uncharacterized protein [Henckelia pumila]|uniref:uncharacterized protein n=1 Tax=Henckelia pumila TaxID=405737 RepID=UPI003C6E56A6
MRCLILLRHSDMCVFASPFPIPSTTILWDSDYDKPITMPTIFKPKEKRMESRSGDTDKEEEIHRPRVIGSWFHDILVKYNYKFTKFTRKFGSQNEKNLEKKNN